MSPTTSYEYKAVPAPTRGKKARGVKTGADRFALAMTDIMNEMARDGWEYLRSDTLPSEERSGLTGRSTVFQNLLVFRRPLLAITDDSAEIEQTAQAAPLRTTADTGKAPTLPSSTQANAVPEKSATTEEEPRDKRDLVAE